MRIAALAYAVESPTAGAPARCANPDRMCVSHVDLGHNCDVSSLRSLRLRPRLGLGVLAGFLVAIPLTLLALSVRAGWDPVRDVDRGVADGLHGMVTHESWAVAALKAVQSPSIRGCSGRLYRYWYLRCCHVVPTGWRGGRRSR